MPSIEETCRHFPRDNSKSFALETDRLRALSELIGTMQADQSYVSSEVTKVRPEALQLAYVAIVDLLRRPSASSDAQFIVAGPPTAFGQPLSRPEEKP